MARLRSTLLSNRVIEEQLRRIQADFSGEIERYLARRLPSGPDSDLDAAVLGASIAAALVSSLRTWGERGGSSTDELRRMTTRALELLRSPPAVLIGPSRTARR